MDPWFHHSSHYPMATMKEILFGCMSRDRIKFWSWLYNQTLHCEHFVRKYWKIGYSNVSRFLLCLHVCECTLVHCILRRFFSIIWWKWHTEVFPLIFCRSEQVNKLWMCLSQRDVQQSLLTDWYQFFLLTFIDWTQLNLIQIRAKQRKRCHIVGPLEISDWCWQWVWNWPRSNTEFTTIIL